MKNIVSLDNELIKKTVKLKDKKYRDLYGEYLIEGFRGVADTPKDIIKAIFITENSFESDFYGDNVYIVSEKVMNKLSLTDTSCGIIAVACKREACEFTNDFVLYLDRIRDPGNMGAIIRTAVAAGYEVVCDNCVDVYNPKVVRSCVSALSKVKLHCGNFIDILVEKGYNIVGADAAGKNVFECSKPDKLCLVIGNEANGLSDEIRRVCKWSCSIPMLDMESLNAAVSAGILMYYFKF